MVTEEELQSMSPEEIAELQRKNCIFCKILKGEVPGKVAYEDDKIAAVLDIRPATKGHILVMPKEHYPVLPLIPADTAKHMFQITKDVTAAVKGGVPTTGTTVFMASGAAAGQMSPHFLFHIIPRNVEDGLEKFNALQGNVDQNDIKEQLQKRIVESMRMVLVQEGKLPPEEVQEAIKQQAAMLLQQNPQLKEALMQNPDAFKQAIEQNPQISQMFQGIDINKLSEELNKMATEKGEGEVSAASEEEETAEDESADNVDEEESNEDEESGEDSEDDNEDNGDDEEDDGDGRQTLDRIAGLFK